MKKKKKGTWELRVQGQIFSTSWLTGKASGPKKRDRRVVTGTWTFLSQGSSCSYWTAVWFWTNRLVPPSFSVSMGKMGMIYSHPTAVKSPWQEGETHTALCLTPIDNSTCGQAPKRKVTSNKWPLYSPYSYFYHGVLCWGQSMEGWPEPTVAQQTPWALPRTSPRDVGYGIGAIGPGMNNVRNSVSGEQTHSGCFVSVSQAHQWI